MYRTFWVPILIVILSTIGCHTNSIDDLPKWSKSAIWYQIFPDRFNNGDKSNDPLPRDVIGGWPYRTTENWQIHPWYSDWYKLQPWEKNENDFYWNVGLRRYGGDIQGIIDKLDYLQDLGINAIYLNPIFESPSLHKYDATFYHHVDNNFGPDPDKDRKIWSEENHEDPTSWQWTTADLLFLKLIEESHKRKIKVIIDGVFNHVGNTFWAFQDVINNQEKSKFKNWFIIESFDNPETKENEFKYNGWYGAKDLPEIKEDKNGLVPGISDHIHAVVKRWMDPNNDGDPSDGIDGWRLDVADMVNHNFWKKFRIWVKEINPEAYITGEIWWEDWSTNKMMNANPWLDGTQFDAVMNYRFTRAVKNFISDDILNITSTAFADSISKLRTDYGDKYFFSQMNLLGSHDTERLASLIINNDFWYDHNGNPRERKDFLVRAPYEIEVKKLKLMVGLQMTLPGAPMIYYGDEVGMWGGDDPDCRKPMVWPELDYENESTHPFQKERETDFVSFDSTLFNWFKKLINIRKNNRELLVGDLKFIDTDNTEILCFIRKLESKTIYVILNRSKEKKSLKKEFEQNISINLINKKKFSSKQNQRINLDPLEIKILK